MSQIRSTYGTVGLATLVAALIVWGVAVVMQDSGVNPDGLTSAIGLVSLALLVVGMAALVKMMFDVYSVESL